MPRLITILLLLCSCAATAGPYVPAGDFALRADIQRLAAHGVIRGTISTWPMAWGPILNDLREVDLSTLPPAIIDAVARVQRRANWETRTGEMTFNTEFGIADNVTRIRSFQDTPRGRVEFSAGVNWTGEWFTVDLNGQFVDSEQDDDDFRLDNSMLGIAVGNWSIGASTMNRWWGPSWDGSLILSSNARPFPSVVIDRIFTDAFETKWLAWLGPWDLNVTFGQLEEDRVVPNAQFFGLRFNFRPIPSLEIGLSRGAQWCGDDRPCDLDTFVDLFLGRDNIGDSGIGEQNEPGNQLAGMDFRWTPTIRGAAMGFYGQVIGEDEAGGFPSRYIGQFGMDWSGYLYQRWSTLAYLEFSGTSCQFHESSKRYNCAYNHSIYQTGYRYRDRSIGHGVDNDAELISAGLVLADASDTQWHVLLRTGKLNDGGAPDPRNTLTATPQDLSSIDVTHSRAFKFGVVEIGAGYESIDDEVSNSSSSDARIYLQWRSSY